jgi:hypothetical protein
VKAAFVRRSGPFSGLTDINAIAMDDGLGFVYYADEAGGIVSADQLPVKSMVHVDPREGEPGHPHDHSRELNMVRGGADEW